MMTLLSVFKKASVLQKIVAVILSLYLLLWLLSSPAIKYFAKPILAEQGLTLAPGASISFNPFLTQITVSDLTAFKADKKVLSTQTLIIRVTLYRLLFDEIAISKMTLDNAFIDVERTPEVFMVAGINVNQDSDNTVKEAPTKSSQASSPYQVLLPELTFNNVALAINNNNKRHHVNLKQLVIHDLSATELSQKASISINSHVDDTEVRLAIDAQATQGSGEIKSQLTIVDYPLDKLTHYITQLSALNGLFSLTSQQTIAFTPEQLTLTISQANMTNKNFLVNYEEQFFTLETLQTSLSEFTLALGDGQLTEFSGNSQLTMANANVYYQKESQKIAHIDNLAINNISLALEQIPTVHIGNILVDQFFASKNETLDLPSLLTLKQLALSDISLNEKYIGIDKVQLDSLNANIILNQDKALTNLVLLPISDDEKQAVTEVEETLAQEINNSEDELILSLGELSFINENKISLQDNSVEPIYERLFFIDTLTLGALSNASAHKEQQTPFVIAGRSNKYAHFNFTGFTQPFAQQPKHHINGDLKEVSLPAISTYMKRAIKMELKSGQLNTHVNVTLTGEELDGNVQVLLQGLETAVADSDEAGALIDQGALPLNMALGMLKDGQGNVELDVPLKGSTSDPQFGLSSIITLITQKAIWMATQDYLMKTFVPYANIVSMTMTVGEFAFKLRFDDLPYEAKQIEPNEKQQAYLKDFIALMHAKKETRVSLCAISTAADIGKENGIKITDKADIKTLKRIAEEREHALKDYLVEQGKIDSSRLLLCSPKIDNDKDSTPRVAIAV